jgi:hypothetical protein
MNFAFSRGPVALAAAAAKCTNAIKATATGDPIPTAIAAGEETDKVVPPPATAPATEEEGDGVNATKQTAAMTKPMGAGQANEENLQPIAEGGKEGEREEGDEGAGDIKGEDGQQDIGIGEGDKPPNMGEPGGNPLISGNPPPDGGRWIAGLDSRQDLLGVVLTEADKKLMEVYGDTVHLNDGRHLHGGIDAATDEQHIKWFDLVVAHPHKLYFPPRCKVGKKFVSMLAGLLWGVIDRRWNSEYPFIFAACIL